MATTTPATPARFASFTNKELDALGFALFCADGADSVALFHEVEKERAIRFRQKNTK